MSNPYRRTPTFARPPGPRTAPTSQIMPEPISAPPRPSPESPEHDFYPQLDDLVRDAMEYGGNLRWQAVYEMQRRSRKALERAYEGMIAERDDQIHRKREARRILGERHAAEIDRLRTGVQAAHKEMQMRLLDLYSCNKDDACLASARGASLALDDFESSMREFGLTDFLTDEPMLRLGPIESDGVGWGDREVRWMG